MCDEVYTQLADGRWVPAQPMPFCEDTRPCLVRVFHGFLALLGWDIDELIEPWYVPLEKPYDRPLSQIRG